MSKSKRLMELMLAVHRKRVFTVKELAVDFGVSSRTILRDLQELGELGVPLYSEVGPHGGYRLLTERMLPPIAFSEEEAVAVFFASHALRHYHDIPFQTEISSALSKFYLHMPQEVRDKIDVMQDRVDFQVPKRKLDSPYLNLLLQAAVEQRVIRVTYDGRKGPEERELLPVGIYASSGLWYCPAYCFSRGDYRLFRCDRILEAQWSAEPAAGLPKTEEVHLGNWNKVHHGSTGFIDLYVELSREGCRRCESELWPLPDISRREDGSGWIASRILKTDIPFFTHYFIGLGLEAKVIQPQELVISVREQLAAMLQKYETTTDKCETKTVNSET